MSEGFRGTVAEYQALYVEKNSYLEQFLERVDLFDFYRDSPCNRGPVQRN